jgi:hypothetical protein
MTLSSSPTPVRPRIFSFVLQRMTQTNTGRFWGAVVPALDGAKFVSEAYASSGSVDAAVTTERTTLGSFLCDLDWTQPDPFADNANARIFGGDDGYCATQAEVVLVKAASVSAAATTIKANSVNVLENRFSNIAVACTFESNYFYCAVLVADLEPVLDISCSGCCSLDACTRR